jgi:hypothetical protein
VDDLERRRSVDTVPVSDRLELPVLLKGIEELGKGRPVHPEVFAGNRVDVHVRTHDLIDLLHPPDVVEVGVGEQDALEARQRPQVLQFVHQPVHVADIDDRPPFFQDINPGARPGVLDPIHALQGGVFFHE